MSGLSAGLTGAFSEASLLWVRLQSSVHWPMHSCRSILYALVEQLSDGIVSAYESALREARDRKRASLDAACMPMTQTRALQMLFDVRFITSVLPKNDDTLVSARFLSCTFTPKKSCQISDSLAVRGVQQTIHCGC